MKTIRSKLKKNLGKVILILTGFASLIWFLIRVVPKPSRANYPCQRAAFPFASAFVVWMATVIGSATIFKKAKSLFAHAKPVNGIAFMGIAFIVFAFSFFIQPIGESVANSLAGLAFDEDEIEKVEMEEKTGPVIDKMLATVGISSIEDEDNITYAQLETMIRDAVEKAGGLEDIVEDGDYVMLKPNVVGADDEDLDGFRGHITHNWVVEIAAKLVRELNPTGEIVVMENSWGITMDQLNKLQYDTIKYLDGYYAFDEVSGDWQEYDAKELVSVSLHDSISLYPDNYKPNNSREIYLNKKYFEADVLISLPVMKNHRSAGITGAVKNVSIGAAVGNIYGEDGGSGTNHRSAHIKHDDNSTNHLHHWIHDFYVCRPVDFSIMDAIEGHDYGPGASQGSKKNMGLILASNDAVAMDAIQGLLMQQSPYKVPYLMYLHNHGQGIADPALIELIGADVPSHRTLFEHNRDQTLYSRFTKTTATNYNASWNIDNTTLSLDITNLDDDLARITIQFDDNNKKRYIVGNFEDITVDISDFNTQSGNLKVIFEDKYLNSKTRTYATGYNSIFNKELKMELSVYPNPATDIIHIETEKNLNTASVNIYNVQGKQVASYKTQGRSTQIDISDLTSGNYILQISDEERVLASERFIKK